MRSPLQVELPDELLQKARKFVEDGWAGGLNGVIGEALRRYLDSHSAELSESFLREDVTWGLHGRD
jgi:hypothetical protein